MSGLLQRLLSFLCLILPVNVSYAADAQLPSVCRHVTPQTVQPYDIAPYWGISPGERGAIYERHQGHKRFHELPLSNEVDEDWRVVCDLYETLYVKNREEKNEEQEIIAKGWFDAEFNLKNMNVKYIKNKGYRDLPKEALFYFWKQAAWVHPDFAESLAQALLRGFEDMVPQRPEWAPYWFSRAQLLKNSPLWYTPEDSLKER